MDSLPFLFHLKEFFTHFVPRFTRRCYGGLFWVSVSDGVRSFVLTNAKASNGPTQLTEITVHVIMGFPFEAHPTKP